MIFKIFSYALLNGIFARTKYIKEQTEATINKLLRKDTKESEVLWLNEMLDVNGIIDNINNTVKSIVERLILRLVCTKTAERQVYLRYWIQPHLWGSWVFSKLIIAIQIQLDGLLHLWLPLLMKSSCSKW